MSSDSRPIFPYPRLAFLLEACLVAGVARGAMAMKVSLIGAPLILVAAILIAGVVKPIVVTRFKTVALVLHAASALAGIIVLFTFYQSAAHPFATNNCLSLDDLEAELQAHESP